MTVCCLYLSDTGKSGRRCTYPKYLLWTTSSTAERESWYMSAATITTQMYRVGRWRGMYLRTKHFLLPAVQMVPYCCAAIGQAVGNRFIVSGRYETLCRLRPAIHSRFQPDQILQALCGSNSSQTENGE